jgi:hypothetical protein
MSGHPITYNHYLTENVQKAQSQRRRQQLKRVLQGIFGQKLLRQEYDLDVNNLLSQLVETTEADMDRYASYAAIDVMEAYYKVCLAANCDHSLATWTNSIKVALKKVVDDISVLAVKECLIQQLPTLFMPEAVFNMDDDIIRGIAAESEEAAAKRERSTVRLHVLEMGLRDLSYLNNHPRRPGECYINCNILLQGRLIVIEAVRESLGLQQRTTSPNDSDNKQDSAVDEPPLGIAAPKDGSNQFDLPTNSTSKKSKKKERLVPMKEW